MIQAINKPDLKVLNKGDVFKVLQVTGNMNMLMPMHHSTKEATIIVLEGSAILEMDGKEHLLRSGDSLIIPAKQAHSLLIMTKFKALVIMPLDSAIEFIN
jgi:quercetin dioxygenase-like cupin family protein